MSREEDFNLDLSSLQGTWTEEQYLKLSEHTNRLIEFTDGYIEVLPMPIERHQAMYITAMSLRRDGSVNAVLRWLTLLAPLSIVPS